MYLAVLGRQAELSLAELEALYINVRQISPNLATFDSKYPPNIWRLGGSLKLAQKLDIEVTECLFNTPEGKIAIGLSDYTDNAPKKSTLLAGMKFKKILNRHGRSVRVVLADEGILPTATSLHNGLGGKNPRKMELIKYHNDWYRVIGMQDVDAYTKRDQARPARDAKVGMLPPKLAQILINLCGFLPSKSRLLDPFCGTGVVLQEAILMNYTAYGTDLSEKMVDYSRENLTWLRDSCFKTPLKNRQFQVSLGDATSFSWEQPINLVVSECYLGKPFSKIPSDMELKEQEQICKSTILKFLQNLAPQIRKNTPVTIAIPAWLRNDNTYSRLKIIDEIANMGYNVSNKSREGLLYHRDGQIVARDIIILRKS